MVYLSAISNQAQISCLNKTTHASDVRDKSSGMSWMSWINTWLHKTINRAPSKSTVHWRIAASWSKAAKWSESCDAVPDCCAGGRKRSLPSLELYRGRLLAYAARQEISRNEEIPGRRGDTSEHTCRDPHKHVVLQNRNSVVVFLLILLLLVLFYACNIKVHQWVENCTKMNTNKCQTR